MAVCSRGHEVVGDNVYRYPKTGREMCKTCRDLRKTWPNNRYMVMVGNARKRDIHVTITLDEYTRLTERPCHYCGKCLDPVGGGLDRLDNDKGYITGNVVPCCGQCNWIKCDNLTENQMLEVGHVLSGFGKYTAGLLSAV